MTEPKKLPLWRRALNRDPAKDDQYAKPFEKQPAKSDWQKKQAKAKKDMKRKGFD